MRQWGAAVKKKMEKRFLLWVAVAYVLSTFFVGPAIPAENLSESFHWRVGPLTLGRPVALTGDSPHYLVYVYSLVDDFDFDLSNNYDRAEAGGWETGTRLRGYPTDRHVETDRMGRQLSYHSPFLPLLLFPIALPFRGTEWVESICVWATLAAGFATVLLFYRWSGYNRFLTLCLAFASPLWCYSRDIWTEPWHALIWVALFCTRSTPLLFALIVVGVLIKVPFAVAPGAIALVCLYRKQWRRCLQFAVPTGAGILLAILFAQYLYQDSDHFDLFHVAQHRGVEEDRILDPAAHFRRLARKPEGIVGVLLHPDSGLLPFFPYLFWGFIGLRRGGERNASAIAYFLVHATFLGWAAGTGFSNRYLVPMIPVLLTAGSAGIERKSRWNRALLAYSFFWGVFAGLLPAVAIDRSPPGVAIYLWNRLIGGQG